MLLFLSVYVQNVTKGARNKILINVQKLHERASVLHQLEKVCLRSLTKVFGSGKAWKMSLKMTHFHRLNWESFFFCSLCLQITCSPLLLNLWCQYVIFQHSWATKRSWKIVYGGLENHGKVLNFVVSRRVVTLFFVAI